MSDMHNYVTSMNACISKCDGVTLASLLSIPVGKIQASKSVKNLAERAKSINPISYCASNISDQGIAAIVGRRLITLVAVVANDWAVAYQNELAVYNAVLDYFKEESSYWIIPALTKVMNDLRLLASQVSLISLNYY